MKNKAEGEPFYESDKLSIADHIPVISAIKHVIEQRQAERRLQSVNGVFEELGRISLSH
jgi:hypothetical protein